MRRLPTQSYTNLRFFTEKWRWIDPRSGIRTTGYVHPQTAREVERVPFYIKFLTQSGHVDEGICVCTSVNTLRHQRCIQFVESGLYRTVNDILVIEVDGTRFITH